MRSRYTAYVLADIPYLVASTHPSMRHYHSPYLLRKWAISSKWEKLEVIKTRKGSSEDKKGEVEFKAYYQDQNGLNQLHHEHSEFVKEGGVWYFLRGEVKN